MTEIVNITYRQNLTRYKRAMAIRDTNLHAWAKEAGQSYDSVRTAISRWGHRPDTPRGGKTAEIMQKLDDYFGCRLLPKQKPQVVRDQPATTTQDH